jgi:hypothetical protein
LAAAQAELKSGAFEIALKLLLTADDGLADELHRAHVNLLRAQITFAGHNLDAARLLIEAARRLEPLDIGLARAAYRDPMGAAILIGPRSDLLEVAHAVRSAPRPAERQPGDLLLDSLAVMFTDGYATAVPLARQAVRAFHNGDGSDASDQAWLWLAAIAAANLRDDESWSIPSASGTAV